MKYMLDTNICIYAIKNKPETVINHLREHKSSEICISSVTNAELACGVEKSSAKERNRIALTILLSNIEILSFNKTAAETYGKVRAELEIKGTPIGPLDMLIASHAKALGLTIVTNNTKEFSRVTGLNVENWAE